MTNANDKLFDFSAPTPPVIQAVPLGDPQSMGEATVVLHGQAMSVPVSGDRAIGDVQWVAVKVFMAQIVLEEEFVLRRNFGTYEDHANDDEFKLLKASIEQVKINVDPMLVERTGRTIDLQGQKYPELRVRSGVRRYWALVALGFPDALVRVLPAELSEQERVLLSLIQNETRVDLSILDRCDVVYALYKHYRMRQHVIAARAGLSQGYVSKLIAAAEQPAVIRAFLSKGSLTLEKVYSLKDIKDDDTRVLAAKYSILHALSAPKVDAMVAELAIPEELGGPSCVLLPPATPNGDVVKRSLVNGVTTDPAPKAKVVPYWKRNAPLRASPVRLLNNRHQVTLSGSLTNPSVTLDSLQSRRFFHQLDRQRATTVELEALEEAMLADLEAIRVALEDGVGEVDPPLELRRVVEADGQPRGRSVS